MKEIELYTAEHPFQLHAYRKQDLAMMYFPDESKDGATRSLRRWIVQCPELLDQLMVEGYNKRLRFYTRREVELIIEYLGLP